MYDSRDWNYTKHWWNGAPFRHQVYDEKLLFTYTVSAHRKIKTVNQRIVNAGTRHVVYLKRGWVPAFDFKIFAKHKPIVYDEDYLFFKRIKHHKVFMKRSENKKLKNVEAYPYSNLWHRQSDLNLLYLNDYDFSVQALEYPGHIRDDAHHITAGDRNYR